MGPYRPHLIPIGRRYNRILARLQTRRYARAKSKEEAMRRLMIACTIAWATTAFAGTALAADAPKFQPDASWPKTLPHNWILGQVGGIAVDAQDHIWVNQRPRSLTDDEKGAALNPPESKCCIPAPPVMEFDNAGNLIQAWGGPGAGYDWPEGEHGIFIGG